VTQRLWRGVEGPRRCSSYPCCSELFNHRSPHRRTRHGLSLGLRTKNLRASCYVRLRHLHSRQPYRHALHRQIPFSGFGGRKAPSSMGKISTAGVLRLRATGAVSRDKSVRRCAQDDDFVGVLKKNILNKLALMEQLPPSRLLKKLHFACLILV
jgi:hypothetical protein